MKMFKYFFIFAFLHLVTFELSITAQTPKIGWKNVQERYESFYEIKPTIINLSNEPIYFNCSPPDLEHSNTDFKLMKFSEETSNFHWNVMICGTMPKKLRKAMEKREKEIAKLKEQGKYAPSGCKLNPNEEFAFNFTNKQWDYLIWGDYETYKSGKFIFKIFYETVSGDANSESPEFFVIPKEETN